MPNNEPWNLGDGLSNVCNSVMRHLLNYLDDPAGVDEESGLPHLSHIATNVAFLCEFAKEGKV